MDIMLLLQQRTTKQRPIRKELWVLEVGATVRSGKVKGTEMIYVQETLISPDDQQATAGLNIVREYLGKHGTALANASYLLGGATASGAVFRLIETVRDARRLTKAHVRQLQRTLALLILENVGDPDRTETMLFADLVPGSRSVEKICLLADALDDLLMQLDQITDAAASQQAEDLSKAA
jgi:hypothetical protein